MAVQIIEKAYQFELSYLIELFGTAIDGLGVYIHANFSVMSKRKLSGLPINDCNVCIILALAVILERPEIARICCMFIKAYLKPIHLNDLRNHLPYFAFVASYIEENLMNLQEMLQIRLK